MSQTNEPDDKPKQADSILPSGLHWELKPNEWVQLSGTPYVVRNEGAVTCKLHFFTQAALEERRRKRFVRGAAQDVSGRSKLKSGSLKK